MVRGRGCGWVAYREEEDARHGGGDGALEHADRELGDLLGGRLGGVRVRVRVRGRVRVRVRVRARVVRVGFVFVLGLGLGVG